MHTKTKLIGLVTVGLLALGASQAKAIPVDLELIMLVDVSGSVSATDFNIQRDGYEAAFRSASVISAIESGAIGSISATFVYWSGSGEQQQAVGWTPISDSTTSNAFADAIAAAGRPYSGSTGMTEALNFGAGLASADNGFEGTRTVIDISGDGSESVDCSSSDSSCVPLQNARDAALAGDVDTINALWIEDDPFFCESGCTIDPLAYGLTNVIGGPNAFQQVVSGFGEFAPAIESKLESEIRGETIPEPSTIALFGVGLAGLGFMRRRRMSH